MNKLFQEYFTLDITQIKNHKINLLKDILKTESIKNRYKYYYPKELIQNSINR